MRYDAATSDWFSAEFFPELGTDIAIPSAAMLLRAIEEMIVSTFLFIMVVSLNFQEH